MRDTLLLIDANSLIHRAFHALPPFTGPDGRPTGALYGLASMVLKILKEKNPKYIAAAFDSKEPTFREGYFPEYKGTRAPTDDNLIPQLIESKTLLEAFGIKTFALVGSEADDLVASLAKMFAGKQNLQVVILSGDRDMFQAVQGDDVVVETPEKGISNTVIYDDVKVKEKFGVGPINIADFKGLVGDKSDNIPGVPGIGPKTAADLIQKYGSIEDIYQNVEGGRFENEKLKSKLVEHKKIALLSKKLAVLKTDCLENIDLKSLEMQSINIPKVTEYFETLGSQSLIDRLNKNYNNQDVLG